MKTISRPALWSSIAAVIAFVAVFVRDYSHLVAHQPPHSGGGPMPTGTTAFPPSFAFVTAGYWAFISFFVAFVAIVIAGTLLARRTPASEVKRA